MGGCFGQQGFECECEKQEFVQMQNHREMSFLSFSGSLVPWVGSGVVLVFLLLLLMMMINGQRYGIVIMLWFASIQTEIEESADWLCSCVMLMHVCFEYMQIYGIANQCVLVGQQYQLYNEDLWRIYAEYVYILFIMAPSRSVFRQTLLWLAAIVSRRRFPVISYD